MQPELATQGVRERWAKPLFILTIVTGSFLLFLTQPMVARMALPRIGGAPAVWNSAMLVYQALLLGGYAYAHWIARLRPRRQAGLHLALFGLAALWLPIGLTAAIPPTDFAPALWVPWFLVSSIGPLFFIISAQAPLMQRWYALESARGEPYALYAASNLGSFAGLLSYPLIVEPLLTLDQQSTLWTFGYALLVVLVVGCAFTVPPDKVEEGYREVTPAPRRRRILHWIALAAVPSGLMLSTTTHLTTDIVAMPLIWVIPLGLYLLSFVVAFADRRGPADFIIQIAPLIILIAGGLAFADGSRSPVFWGTLGLSLLFTVAVALHGAMYRLRPAPDHLTAFYLAMSVGGVLGGLLSAILAPTLFDWAYEHPILIVAAALLLPQAPLFGALRRLWEHPKRGELLTLLLPLGALLLSMVSDQRLWPGIPDMLAVGGSIAIALMALVSIGRPAVFAACLAALMLSYGGWASLKQSMSDMRTRSYFGIYTVAEREGPVRTLTHGTTLHGVQNLAPGQEREPTSYYGRESGVGLAMDAIPIMFDPGANVGVVGLGTGTLACYRQPDQNWTFFEIDPVMAEIARTRFSFLSRCAPEAEIVLGDARLSLAGQPEGKFHLLAIDAFSSDAIPTHLLTREAMAVYRRALRPDGLLLIHISNRYIDLRPVLAANARSGGWHAAIYQDVVAPAANVNNNTSVWVALAPNIDTLRILQIASWENAGGWRRLPESPGFAGWRDGYASILPLMKDWLP